MPTGYTSDVHNGKVTELKDYALACARAFGANILMRDDPSGAPIREYEPSSFYSDNLSESAQRLNEIQGMSVEECEEEAAIEFRKAVIRQNGYLAECNEQKERYEAMLAQVREWQQPSPGHAEFKKFMEEQLTVSIEFDCSTDYLTEPVRKTGEQWRAEQIERLEKEIPRYRQQHQEEVERTNERNRWNRQLIESLT